MGRHSAPKKVNFFAVALPIFIATLILSAGVAVVQFGPLINPPSASPGEIIPVVPTPTSTAPIVISNVNSGSSNFPNEPTMTPTTSPSTPPSIVKPVPVKPTPITPKPTPTPTATRVAISSNVLVNLNAIAECESGGDWAINSGNGYYGGLQFSQATWVSLGGLKLGLRADLATKDEQLQIAAKLQAQSGYGSWPACSAKLKLG